MKFYILIFIASLVLGFNTTAFAKKCTLQCPKGSNSITCDVGCYCVCNDQGKADCYCSGGAQKTCDVQCKKGSKSITCTNGCMCYCDNNDKPMCKCS